MAKASSYNEFVRRQSARGQMRGHLEEAIRCHQSGELSKAEEVYQRILEVEPNHSVALHLLGLIAHQIGNNRKAIRLIGKAIENEPNNPMYHNNLGLAFEELHQLQEAVSCYQKAVHLDPECFEAYTNMGNALKAQGQLNEATLCHKKALRLKPDHTESLLNLVQTQRLSDPDTKELFQLAEPLTKRTLSEDDSIRLYFALGKLCHDLEEFDKGFEYWSRANSLKRSSIDFDLETHRNYITRTIETFSDEFIGERQSWASDSTVPIFIFGMPRSGTTLVEQILASHPVVFGGGELQFFVQAEEKLPTILETDLTYPECLREMHYKTARNMGKVYIKKTKKLDGLTRNHSRITDKNPYNFLHLGLISLLFPKARFVHCKRHPLDTCLSIYSYNFTTGNHFAYDLKELGLYYREYLKLMDHWKKVVPVNMFEVSYEDLVQCQKKTSKQLLEYCGLSWEPACLEFYKHERPVFTASDWQVRQPIYGTSCGRWKNYDRFLSPLKELLVGLI